MRGADIGQGRQHQLWQEATMATSNQQLEIRRKGQKGKGDITECLLRILWIDASINVKIEDP